MYSGKIIILIIFLTRIDQNLSEGSITETCKLLWSIAWPFLKDEYTLTISGVRDESFNFWLMFSETIPRQDYPAATGRLDETSFTEHTDLVYEYAARGVLSSHESYVFINHRYFLAQTRMLHAAIIDENGYGIYLMYNGTKEQVRQLLRDGWEKYSMINIMGAVVEDDPQTLSQSENSSRFGVQSENYRLTLMVYDPFAIQDFGERGRMYEWQIDANNVETVSKSAIGLTRNRFANVHGYPLRVCIFEFSGITEAVRDKDGYVLRYTNMDGEITRTIVERLNFTPKYIVPSDSGTFGRKEENGSFSGALGIMETGQADLSANVRAILDHGQKNIEYLFPVDDARIWFLTPAAKRASDFPEISFYNLFGTYSLVYLGATYLVLVASFWSLNQVRYTYIKNNNSSSQTKTLTDFCMEVFVLFITSPQKISVNNLHEKWIFVALILFATVVSTFYQGIMLKLLTSKPRSNDINTLEELAASSLEIHADSALSSLLNTSVDDEVFGALLEKQVVTDNLTESLIGVAERRKNALLLADVMCLIMWSRAYSNETGERLVHILRDGPPARYRSQMIPKLSAYKDVFNGILMRLREGGLIQLWEDRQFLDIRLASLMLQTTSNDVENNNMFTMRELEMVFRNWFMFIGVCFFVLLLEIFIDYYLKKTTKKAKQKVLGSRKMMCDAPPHEFVL